MQMKNTVKLLSPILLCLIAAYYQFQFILELCLIIFGVIVNLLFFPEIFNVAHPFFRPSNKQWLVVALPLLAISSATLLLGREFHWCYYTTWKEIFSEFTADPLCIIWGTLFRILMLELFFRPFLQSLLEYSIKWLAQEITNKNINTDSLSVGIPISVLPPIIYSLGFYFYKDNLEMFSSIHFTILGICLNFMYFKWKNVYVTLCTALCFFVPLYAFVYLID